MRRDDGLLRIRRSEKIPRSRAAVPSGERRGREQAAANPSTLDSRPSTIFVAPPRIFKTGEEWTLEQVRSCNADGYLVRNYDHLKFFANDRRIGDFSLNVANRLAADYFKNQFGLERVTACYDLNFQQLEALLSAAPPEWFEVTIHQHMPMFHMEHCVFCAFLSSGTDFRNCGRPCDRHDVKLRDRVGAEHPVKADVGCRNTVFNALAQTGAEYVSRMLALGVRHFRVEFLNETPEQVDADHRPIPPAPARRNHRRATLARIEIAQSARRHPRSDWEIDHSVQSNSRIMRTIPRPYSSRFIQSNGDAQAQGLQNFLQRCQSRIAVF